MKARDHRQRLRRATLEAQARRDRARAEIEGREDHRPRPGDVLSFRETAERSVLWVVLTEDTAGEPPQVLLVAADLCPFIGSSDVAAPATSAGGALVLRCGFEVRLDARSCEAARHVGLTEPELLDRARRKRAQIEAGAVTGSVLERDTDGDPDYQDWLEEGPAPARAQLLESAGNRIYVNGVDAVTGGYLMPAAHPSRIADWARRERVDPGVLSLLRHVHRLSSQPHLGLPSGVDPRDVAQAGWAVVFHSAESQAVKEALQPLIEHRQARLGAAKTRILEYRPGEAWRRWLSRHGIAAGRMQPSKVPYYLFLVGSPARIPYDFQLSLGVEYAVGRLGLETAGEVRRYAQSVVDHETRPPAGQDKTVAFFGPRHAFDPATRWSADRLVKPLMEGVSRGRAVRGLWGEAATKANLKEVFHPPGDIGPPALVFGAAHGLSWPADHPRQLASQGALLCQDWPALGRVDPESHGFGAGDLSGEAQVHGTVVFLHASYSAGTPELGGPEPPQRIAGEPFVSGLARRLLTHPRGSAAALIGRVDRAWTFPAAPAAAAEVRPFQDALEGLLDGWPVGHAVRELEKRYAALAIRLDALRQKMAMGARLDEAEVAALWSERSAARGTVVVGDPAVRLRVEALD